jgi:pimeloyl-ACP methyl ester carboxylesterase
MNQRLDHLRRVRRLLGAALRAIFFTACASQPAPTKDWNMPQVSSAQTTEVASSSAGSASHPLASGHASVNGLSLYYEVHGTAPGTPLLLLHGGGSSIGVTYGRILPYLASGRRVIAVDEQAHGRSGDRDTPVRFTSSADDAAALLGQLGIERADVMGFSNGASVALQLVLRHPARVRKLIFASAMTKRSGAPPQFWQFIQAATFADMPQPLKDAFLGLNPDPEKLRVMHDKDLERMQSFEDVSDAQVRSVQAPTLVLTGDRDVATLEHSVELTRLFPRAQLMILPGGHGDYLGELLATRPGDRYPELTAGLLASFLDAPATQ